VRPGSLTKVSVPLVVPQNRHPERSASQIDCVTQCLWRGVEGPRRRLFYPCCSELFDHRSRTTGSAVAVIAGIASLASSFANAVCNFRFTGTHRGRSQVAFSFPSLLCGLPVQMTTAVAAVGIAFPASSFANAVCRFRFTGTHRGRSQVAFSFPSLLCGLSA
jgi:hypothetical protein